MPDLDTLLHTAARDTRAVFTHASDVSTVRATSRRRTTFRYLTAGFTTAAVVAGAVVLTHRDPGEQQAPARGHPDVSAASAADTIAGWIKSMPGLEPILAEAGDAQRQLFADGYVRRDEMDAAATAMVACMASHGVTGSYRWDVDDTIVSSFQTLDDGLIDRCRTATMAAVEHIYSLQRITGGYDETVHPSVAACLGTAGIAADGWPTPEVAPDDAASEATCWNAAVYTPHETSTTATTDPSAPRRTATDETIGPLYVLPDPESGIVVHNGSSQVDQPNGPVQTSFTFALLGKSDGAGFSSLMNVRVHDEEPADLPADRTPVDLATGPAVWFDFQGPGPPMIHRETLVQQRSNRWLAVSGPDVATMSTVIDGLALNTDGTLDFSTLPAPFKLVETIPVTVPSAGSNSTYFELETLDPEQTIVVETAFTPSELVMAMALSDRIEPMVIAGNEGWLATLADDSPALMWMADEHHAVFVSGDASIAELTRTAQSLRVVDRATWHAAFPEDSESGSNG